MRPSEPRRMTLEQIEARMLELDAHFAMSPDPESDTEDLLLEYFRLDAEWDRRACI